MSKWQDSEIVEIVEDQEETEMTDEETNLAGMGIMPERIQHFHKRYPQGKAFENGQLTKIFFVWLLDVVSEDELKTIDGTKISNELQMLLTEKITEGVVKFEDSAIQQYIDKNKELLARNKFLENESLELKKSIKFYDDMGRKYFLFTKFLYNLMGEKMAFKDNITVNDEEIKKLEEIELIKKEGK